MSEKDKPSVADMPEMNPERIHSDPDVPAMSRIIVRRIKDGAIVYDEFGLPYVQLPPAEDYPDDHPADSAENPLCS